MDNLIILESPSLKLKNSNLNSNLEFNPYVVSSLSNIKGDNLKVKHIIFDLDGTLIKTKSGNKFPKSATDFEFLPYVLDKLKALSEDGYHIIIVSNQAFNKKSLIRKKILNVYSELKELNVSIFVALKHDKYRKPNIGLWEDYIKPLKVKKGTLFVGDALGRKGDFSDSDLMFVKNVNKEYPKALKVVSPEKYFSS